VVRQLSESDRSGTCRPVPGRRGGAVQRQPGGCSVTTLMNEPVSPAGSASMGIGSAKRFAGEATSSVRTLDQNRPPTPDIARAGSSTERRRPQGR